MKKREGAGFPAPSMFLWRLAAAVISAVSAAQTADQDDDDQPVAAAVAKTIEAAHCFSPFLPSSTVYAKVKSVFQIEYFFVYSNYKKLNNLRK